MRLYCNIGYTKKIIRSPVVKIWIQIVRKGVRVPDGDATKIWNNYLILESASWEGMGKDKSWKVSVVLDTLKFEDQVSVL